MRRVLRKKLNQLLLVSLLLICFSAQAEDQFLHGGSAHAQWHAPLIDSRPFHPGAYHAKYDVMFRKPEWVKSMVDDLMPINGHDLHHFTQGPWTDHCGVYGQRCE